MEEEDERSWANLAFEKDSAEQKTKLIENTQTKNCDEPHVIPLSEKQKLLEVRSIKKNLICVTICGILVTTPMLALTNSITSLLDDNGLGIASLSASSISQFLGSALLLNYFNKIWGVRKMVSVTLFLPIPYTVSYLCPNWGTMLPTGILLGLGQAFLTSTLMYGNSLGYYYGVLTKGNSDVIMVGITGLLTSFFGAGLLLGNTIMFAVFNFDLEVSNYTLSKEVSHRVCGAHYCNEDLSEMPTMQKPEPWRYYTTVTIFTAMSILGGILSLFVRDFSLELKQTLRNKSEYFLIMKETLGLLTDHQGFLLIVLTVFIGLEEAFMAADFTQAYISCPFGIPKVGLVMLCFGGLQTTVFLSQGLFVKIFGRLLLITFGTVLVLSSCLAVYLWHPDSEYLNILFILSLLWAAGDAIIVSAVFAMYGILFEHNIEGSLSLATFWWAFGFMVAFVWSHFLCVSTKLIITMATGCVGLCCYLILELLLRKMSTKEVKLT